MPGTKRGGGPKTAAGKAAIASNNLRHGLLSRRLLLDREDPAELEALAERLHAQLTPEGALETLLVERIVAATWRLNRALNAETRQMQHKYAFALQAAEGQYAGGAAGRPEHPGHQLAANYAEASVLNEDKLDRIGRYETAIERQLYRALHELQTLQASRLTGMPLVPGAYRIFISPPKRQPPTEPASDTPTP